MPGASFERGVADHEICPHLRIAGRAGHHLGDAHGHPRRRPRQLLRVDVVRFPGHDGGDDLHVRRGEALSRYRAWRDHQVQARFPDGAGDRGRRGPRLHPRVGDLPGRHRLPLHGRLSGRNGRRSSGPGQERGRGGARDGRL